jgi:hypothetical protein
MQWKGRVFSTLVIRVRSATHDAVPLWERAFELGYFDLARLGSQVRGHKGLFNANRFLIPGRPLGLLRATFCRRRLCTGSLGVRPEKLTDRSLIALYESVRRQTMAATVRSRVLGQHTTEYAEKLRAEMERRQIRFASIDPMPSLFLKPTNRLICL